MRRALLITLLVSAPIALVASGCGDDGAYVAAQADELVAKTTVLTDAARAGKRAVATGAYAPSREPWERIEPIAGLIAAIDGVADLDIPPAAMALGAAELIQEVSEGKITGEEDRYSKTDLWDFAANDEGAHEIIEFLEPALEKADPELLAEIEDGFADLEASLATLRKGDGDLLLTVQAEHADTVVFALRQLMRRTRSTLTLKWVVDGFNRRGAAGERSTGSPRNFLGFLDGTANIATDPSMLARHVWTSPTDDEPDWTAGGSYHVARVIRMLVEFWDRTPPASRS